MSRLHKIAMSIGALSRSRSNRGASHSRRGVSVVFLTLLFPTVLSVSAYSINVAYMELGRTELQITTDVATRAAGRALAVTGKQSEAILAAERLLSANPFANQTLSLSDVEVIFGVSTRHAEFERYIFGTGNKPNAVKIVGNGDVRVPMLFPTMGIDVNYQPLKTAISTNTEMDIALVLDRSGSMAYASNESANGSVPPAAAPPGWTFGQPVPSPSRWRELTTAVESFIQLVETSGHNEQLSLSTYSTGSGINQKLTDNYTSIRDEMSKITNNFGGGWTNIGDGILDGAETLADKSSARPWASRVLIVLTDGNHNTGTDPIYAANLIASEHIQIYTVTFSAEADTTRMAEVAKIGGGLHFHANGGTELIKAFEEIFRSLPTLITY